MGAYIGSLRIEGDSAPPVECAVTVGDGRLVVVSGGRQIGEQLVDHIRWKLHASIGAGDAGQ